MILAGDIGGTKARLAWYRFEHGSLVRENTATFAVRDYASLAEVVAAFVTRFPARAARACLGVPGPVIQGRAQAANLPWQLDEQQLQKALGLTHVKLVNDLFATAAAIPLLTAGDLITLNPGEAPAGEATYAVLAPGTGLGQGFYHSRAGVLPSEGGHVDFAPTTEIEIELLRFLRTRFPRVSFERVLSGPGLVNIYEFLRETGRAPEPPKLRQRLQCEDPAAVIATAGLADEFPICAQALDLFAAILGAQAGNLVLTLLATGGVYLGGGVSMKIARKLQDGTVLKAFLNKGRLSDLVKKTPLHIIRDDQVALRGAAALAARL
ncbi:MAG: glucokinase [candidate division KSB1 bacterium]|nr:glucokinase [candidate division KSB1 bacterium]MDZ7275424.1 glucokinase [candidate division KSB1 bacterium]MDZ7286264.1 glucokinase [candidate division KSB1 bacterium]MDZ7296490.1 glucokinase [candidate division KSB1 bacterium]MDZ7305552.1 glucokinase [candidate division KSB1 bacterium]